MPGEGLYIGSKLKKARLQQQIHINRAVEDLHIPGKYLKAFEKNDVTGFPNGAYAIGFLKNYADYLGLEEAPLVGELKNHLHIEPLDIRTCRPLEKPGKKSWVGKAALVLVFLLIAAGVYFGWRYYQGSNYAVAATDAMPAHLATFLEEDGNSGN